jgi:PAS domain S-box-containing protein
MLLVDTNFTIERVNKAAEELVGKGNLDEIIGRKCYTVLHHRDSPMENCPLKKALKSGKVEMLDQYEHDFDKYLSVKCSPIFDANENIIHLVCLMHDITERRRKDILEAQSELQSLLTDAVPLLLKGAPPEKANRFIHQMCNSIEAVLWKKHLAEVKEVDMNTLGTILCQIMNEMGGDFELKSVDDKKCIVKGNACPWGTQAQRNPVLCMLCRGIFSRLATKVFRDVTVTLDKTIGNKDDYCIIIISTHVYG